MDALHLATWPPSSKRATRALSDLMTPTTAFVLGLVLSALTAIGDYLTAAEVGFTILYLVPIGLVVWWSGSRAGLVFCALSTLAFLGTSLATTPSTSGHALLVLGWNVLGETTVFIAFAVLLGRLRERLDREVRERESVVVQLRHADRLTTLGKLASGIAHELGTPLNVVAGRASLIASGKVEGEDAKKSAEIVQQQAARMTGIIQNLLTFARRGGSRKSPTDLQKLAGEAVELMRPLARKQGVELTLETGGACIAPVNASEIQQVLTNIVMNAVHASRSGGVVRLRVEREPAEGGRRRKDDGYVLLRVRDEGTGIDPEALPHIFEPFFTTKDVGAGTGLGLSVAFGIVRDHGGTIDVSSELGKGTELVVVLPEVERSAR